MHALYGNTLPWDTVAPHGDVDARLLLVGSSDDFNMLVGLPFVPGVWSMSRRRRNKAMHALHGNGGPPWQTVGRPLGEARLLQDQHPVSKLRGAGWQIPAEVPDTYLLRVYDTRLAPEWLQTLSHELCGGPEAGYIVGGDFLSRPYVEDSVALHPTELRRWGPEGQAAYRLIIPPRPHVAAWAQRCVSQMQIEAPDTVCTMYMVVPREQI